MKVIVNGKESDFVDGLTVRGLLSEQNVKMPDMVSVELNGQILKKTEFEEKTLNDGDKIEFLYFMGGGNVTN